MNLLIRKLNKTFTLYILTILFLITFFAYANTLSNGLFYDDEDFIYNNVYVKHFQVAKFFTENLIAGAGKVSNYYRPLLATWFSIEWQIVGDNGFLYHLDSLIIHAFAGIALYILSKKFFNKTIAFITSILFLIHPIQTEAVSYVSGRSDPMMAFFMFVTIILFLRNTKRSKLISYCTLVLALMSRETAIITPVIIMLLCWYKLGSWKLVWKQKTNYIPYITIAAVYFFLRLTVLNFQDTLNFYGSMSNPYAASLPNRLYTFLSTLPTYFSILFFPKTLFIDRDTPVMTSLLQPLVFIPLFFAVGMLAASIKWIKQYPIFFFCLAWFFITISPTSGILPINGIIYEHFLYLPSIAVFLLIAYGIWLIVEKVKSRSFSIVIFSILSSLFLLLLFRTIVRNADWHDSITFYNQVIANNPKSARIHNNLAIAYAENKEDRKAIDQYKIAIKLLDFYPQTHYNLANTYVDMNDIVDAEKEYERTLHMDKEFYQAYFPLAEIYKQSGQTKKLENLVSQLNILAQKSPNFLTILEKVKSL